MLLLLRVVVADDAAHDLVLDVDAGHRVADLAAAITHQLARPVLGLLHVRSGRSLDPDEPVDGSGILSGDTLRVTDGSPAVTSPRHEPAVAVTLAVVSGPDAGRWRLLGPGRHVVGRHDGADVVLADPSVSRRHAVVTIGAGFEVEVAAHPDASSAVLLDGVDVDGPVPLRADQLLALGATRLAVRPFACGEVRRSDRLGHLEFQRTPYRPPSPEGAGDEVVGPIPVRPEARRLQLVGVLGPLVAGLALFVFSRQVQFLALTLMSPLVMIATAVDDRRSGRRSARRAVAEFRDALVVRRCELAARRSAERSHRWAAAPDLADLAQRAERRSIDLWPRGRTADDFLRLRIGIGASRVGYAIELDRGGDDDLRAEAAAAVDGLTSLDEVPITIDLVGAGVVGVHGRAAAVDGLLAALLTQAACLHSPDDLTIVAAVATARPVAWLKWLPHLRSVTSPVAGAHLVSDADDADALVTALLDVVDFRLGDGADRIRRGDVPQWPRVLAVLDAAVGADAADVARLLDLGPAAGVSVLWLADRPADVPHQAALVVRVDGTPEGVARGTLWSVDSQVAPTELTVERLDVTRAERVSRHLAPIRDASTASVATSIPRTVDLLDVVGADATDASALAARWTAAPAGSLAFPIGVGAGGVVDLDLVHDGPHALIGGTSGAGKSELLQAMVASLACRYPSTRLNFLFVDYKGGASSKVFERLPHTVGYVTNLGADLAVRALTSLRAELHHRMALMEGRAKDLDELVSVAPEIAPPSLVIVVDEFATLVKEVPEFVAGIVDVAQRGRSLGIHLVLATQRPSGAVNENILANTNLRISLRMLDRAESSAVIGVPDAADIPVPLRGRALARTGARQPVPFQSAYGGAPLVTAAADRPVLVGAFESPHSRPTAVVTASDHPAAGTGRTQLDAVVDAVVEADRRLHLPAARRPWCDALADVVTLDAVLDDPRADPARRHPGRFVVAGLLDAPERQEQAPFVVDLEDGGGWLLFGSGGSGKTTALRTVAVSFHRTGGPDAVATLAFDFASRGLAALRALPSVIDVATGDDLEAVTRHVLVLDGEIARRRALLARAGAEHLTAYNERHAPLHRIVVLVDGIGAMLDALGEGSSMLTTQGDSWVERLLRVLVDGRQVGVHAVVTADRRNAVPSRLHAAIANRTVLRHADETAYAEHGIGPSTARGLDLVPGRGWSAGSVVQIAVVAAAASGRDQADAIESLAGPERGRRTTVLSTRPLPDHVPAAHVALAAELGVLEPYEVPLGIVDVTGEPAVLDLRWSHALVAGPPRSGRSTALATIACGLASRYDVVCLGAASSGLAGAAPAAAVFGRPIDVAPVVERIANQLSMGAPRRPIAVVVDDLDALDDPVLAAAWDRLLVHEHVRVVAAVESRTLTGFTTNPLVVELKRARRSLFLRPDDPAEFVQSTGVRLPQRPGLAWVPGRGVLLCDRVPRVVQVAAADAAPASRAGLLAGVGHAPGAIGGA